MRTRHHGGERGGDVGNAVGQTGSQVVNMCEFYARRDKWCGNLVNHFLGKISTNIREDLAKGEKEKEGNKFFFLQVIVFYLLVVNGFWRVGE